MYIYTTDIYRIYTIDICQELCDMKCLTPIRTMIMNRNHNSWSGWSWQMISIKTIMIKRIKIAMTATLITLHCGRYNLTRITNMTTAACSPTLEVHHRSHSANHQDSESPNSVGFLCSKTCSIFLAHLPSNQPLPQLEQCQTKQFQRTKKCCFCSCGFFEMMPKPKKTST